MSDQNEQGARVAAVLIALFAIALFVYFVGTIAEIVLLFFIATILAVYFRVVTDLLIRWVRLPNFAALPITVVLTAAGAFGVVALIMPPVVSQSQDLLRSLPEMSGRIEAVLNAFIGRFPLGRLTTELDAATVLQRVVNDASEFVGNSFLPYVTAGGRLLVEFFSVVAMAIYLAMDPRSYWEGTISLFPPAARDIARNALSDLVETLRLWVGGQAIAMVFLGTVTGLGLWALQVPYALAFGVFTGAVAIVPFFGTVTSTLLPATFVLATGSFGHAFAVLLLGVLIHLVEANVVYPYVFRMRINLPPVLTILSILVSVTVLGILGLIVAVPMLAAIIVLVRHVLLREIYGEAKTAVSTAVLVPTSEQRAIRVP